ncbi:MAG: hypothetical protein ACXVW1_05110 [Nocardioides sp.]
MPTTPAVRRAVLAARVGLVLQVLPYPLVVVPSAGPWLARIALVGSVLALLVCLVLALSLVRVPALRTPATLCATGSALVLGADAYLWSMGDESTAIPLGGFAALLVGLVLLLVGSATLPRQGTPLRG